MMFIKCPTPWSLVLFLLTVGMIVISLSMTGCNETPPIPPIDITLWAGDSERGGITRMQEMRYLPAHDPDFDQFACMTYTDLKEIYSTLLYCKEWDKKPMTKKEFKKFVGKNIDVLHNASDPSPPTNTQHQP